MNLMGDGFINLATVIIETVYKTYLQLPFFVLIVANSISYFILMWFLINLIMANNYCSAESYSKSNF